MLQDCDDRRGNLDSFNRSTRFTTQSTFHDENMTFSNEETQNYPNSSFGKNFVVSDFEKGSSASGTTAYQDEFGSSFQQGQYDISFRGSYNKYTVEDKIWIAQSLERIGSKATNMILAQKYGKPLARSTLSLIRKQYCNMQKDNDKDQ